MGDFFAGSWALFSGIATSVVGVFLGALLLTTIAVVMIVVGGTKLEREKTPLTNGRRETNDTTH